MGSCSTGNVFTERWTLPENPSVVGYHFRLRNANTYLCLHSNYTSYTDLNPHPVVEKGCLNAEDAHQTLYLDNL